MNVDELREHVRTAVEVRGVATVARECGVSPGGLRSFMAGTCSAGTEALIRLNLSAPSTGGEAA